MYDDLDYGMHLLRTEMRYRQRMPQLDGDTPPSPSTIGLQRDQAGGNIRLEPGRARIASNAYMMWINWFSHHVEFATRQIHVPELAVAALIAATLKNIFVLIATDSNDIGITVSHSLGTNSYYGSAEYHRHVCKQSFGSAKVKSCSLSVIFFQSEISI